MKTSLIKTLLFLAVPAVIITACQPGEVKTNLAENVETEIKQQTPDPEEAEIKALIEDLLFAAGNYNIEDLDEMVSDKANLGIAVFRDGVWKNSVVTISEYFENVRNRKLEPYYEPVNEYIIHVNEGQIAFVWADATLCKYGVPRTNNIDNFTLIKEDGEWKFLNLSFTNKQLPEESRKYNIEIFARSYAQAWGSNRPGFVASYFAEDGSIRVNEGEPAIGRDAITKFAEGFMTDLPDMIVRYDSIVSKTDGTEFHWTLIATNTGPGGTGNKIKVSGYEFWQLDENGIIRNSQGHFPSKEYNRQLKFGIDN
ncbi:MAG TPA: nuclear transport factor 2 family protein [Bacteroidales bacterium]